MNTILIANSAVYLALATKEWRRIGFVHVDELVGVLGQYFPRGAKVRALYQSTSLSREHDDIPNVGAGRDEEVLLQRHARLESPLYAWAHCRSGSEQVQLYQETRAFLYVLKELLENRHGIVLESAVPWSVLLESYTADPGRAAASIFADASRAWIEGFSSSGEALSRVVEADSRSAMLVQLGEVLHQCGLGYNERSGLPGRIQFLWISKEDAPDESGAFWKDITAFHFCVSKSLMQRVSGLKAQSFSGGHNFLRNHGRGWDARPLIRGLAIAAALLVLGTLVYWKIEYKTAELRTAALRAKSISMRDSEAKAISVSNELSAIESLYSRDAGWGKADPLSLLRILGNVTPVNASLDQFEWTEDDRVKISGTVWSLEEKQTLDAWLKSFEGSLDREVGMLHLDPSFREVDLKAASFALGGILQRKES